MNENNKRWEWLFRAALMSLLGIIWSGIKESKDKTDSVITTLAIIQSNRFTSLDWAPMNA